MGLGASSAALETHASECLSACSALASRSRQAGQMLASLFVSSTSWSSQMLHLSTEIAFRVHFWVAENVETPMLPHEIEVACCVGTLSKGSSALSIACACSKQVVWSCLKK